MAKTKKRNRRKQQQAEADGTPTAAVPDLNPDSAASPPTDISPEDGGGQSVPNPDATPAVGSSGGDDEDVKRVDTKDEDVDEPEPPAKRPRKKKKKKQSVEKGGGGQVGRTGAAADIPSTTSDTGEHLEQHAGLVRIDECRVLVKRGFVPNMRSEAQVFATADLMRLLLSEMETSGGSSMIPALRQVANVAGLPGIVGMSMGMPDIHSGYGFAIGNVCAMDVRDPDAVVSPGGVGFDINCGVRLLRTSLLEADVTDVKDDLATRLFQQIPVGAGAGRGLDLSHKNLQEVLRRGMGYLLEEGLVWPEDLESCEEGGCLGWAQPNKVSDRAKKRGMNQVGTMGAGNHYTEVQVVDEIFDKEAAAAMGITTVGQVCVMIHSGSRGLGHQVCTDYLVKLDELMKKSNMKLNDRQLACAPIQSELGGDYLGAMAAAANFAFANRSIIASQTRQAFEGIFQRSARDMDMHMVYDVCHNVAKFEEHSWEGSEGPQRVLVHRKGATRAFPPGHPALPEKYRAVGQPVLIGGSMGTCSYVLTGQHKAMEETFGSTCHGAGRQLSRTAASRKFNASTIKAELASRGVAVRAGNTKLLAEEHEGAYKDVTAVVETCHQAGISKLCVRLRPIAVVKG